MGARKNPNPSPLVPVGDPTDPHSIEAHLSEWFSYLEVHNFAKTSITVRPKASGRLDSCRTRSQWR